ncbi:hypothetical protein KQI42_14030 [Tissierella sp. MSJ-40]|uniref:DUF2268 domain-containing protein n=1 Tax=Tissierella simiarum TaxID=2841534 RepID=A0ABS6E8H1_9FIRM|nr:hypothetical protein [Tissierella simiarum]MBU5439136.1 hypothetical protein [Tissierella simiarum]
MKLNTEIIEQYFSNKSINNMIDHWIFRSIVPGKHMYQEPLKENYDRLKNIYEMLLKSLRDFKPLNSQLWEQFFGEYNALSEDVTVYIIVGSPDPYDSMIRQDKEGNKCIIFDLERIRSYSENDDKISEIIMQLITHEIAHIYIKKKYRSSSIEDSIYENLRYIVFNEGIAHFLSFDKEVLSTDWYTNEMMERKEKAYSTLLNEMKNNSQDRKDEILARANSGKYWDKFGAISGLFAIVDYYNSHNKDLICFREIFKEGPDILLETINVSNK